MRALAFALALALAVPAAAHAREWQVAAGVTGHRAPSSSVDGLSVRDTIPLAELMVAVGLTRQAPILGSVAAELRYQAGGTEAVDFGALRGELGVDSLRAGLIASRPIVRRVRAFVRGDVGFLTGVVTMTAIGSTGDELRLRDRAWTTAGFAGIGADLALYEASAGAPDPDLAIGLRFEAGLLQAGELAFAARPDHPDDGIHRIDDAPAPLGTIDLAGWSLGLQLFGRW